MMVNEMINYVLLDQLGHCKKKFKLLFFKIIVRYFLDLLFLEPCFFNKGILIVESKIYYFLHNLNRSIFGVLLIQRPKIFLYIIGLL